MKPFDTNYIPGSMSFAEGFLGPKGDVGCMMLLNRTKARKVVRKLIKEGRKITISTIGLDGDWRENNEVIYDGKFKNKPKDFACYHGSQWATPILIVEFEDSPSEAYEVWTKQKED